MPILQVAKFGEWIFAINQLACEVHLCRFCSVLLNRWWHRAFESHLIKTGHLGYLNLLFVTSSPLEFETEDYSGASD